MLLLGTKNQIFKYRPSGSLVFTFGLEGGRGLRAVPYNKMRFKYVRSLAVDFNNTLYIGIVFILIIIHTCCWLLIILKSGKKCSTWTYGFVRCNNWRVEERFLWPNKVIKE